MSQDELGKAAGISQSTVAQIERGRNKGSKHILALARALGGVSATWLQSGKGEMRESPKHKTSADDASIRGEKTPLLREIPTQRRLKIWETSVQFGANVLPLPRTIPVLSYEMAAQMTPQTDPNTIGAPIGTVTIHQPMSGAAFAVLIHDAAMEPKFDRLHVVVTIDPARAPKPGDIVLGRIRGGSSVVRKYKELGLDERGKMTFELVPLNSDFATLHSERDGLEVIGAMASFTHYVDEWAPS